ncbi:MAG: sulfurtransferase, partial [Burkholderiales bacterium]|nr:sulfurtransferase [Burkholderiales bacterium]
MPYTTLVSTEILARHLRDAGWRVFDCRHDLAKPELGATQYAEAHIPGALHAHMDRDLAAPPTGRNGRHPLPSPQAFAAWLGAQGLRPGDQVVAYDAAGGTSAARLWWMLRWVGHAAVAVLDGGFAAWRAEGRPVTDAVPRFAPSTYPVRPHAGMHVDAQALQAQLTGGEAVVLDARSAERYRGEREPVDPVAGRIPGSRNRFCGLNLAEGGRFKSAEVLRGEFTSLLAGQRPESVVHSCGSGVAACHNQLAMEIAGLPGSRVYPGSWSEWIADP